MKEIEWVIKISEEDLDCIKYLKAKGWASRHELQILNGIPLTKCEVLDKIRAEIVHLHDWAFSREEVLRLIDKYKSESEGKE